MVQKTMARGLDLRDEMLINGVPVPDGHTYVASNGDGTVTTAPVSGAPGNLDTSKAVTIATPADWSGPTSGEYTATITAATHALGTDVYISSVFETATGDQVNLGVSRDGSGNFTLTVSATPDERDNLTAIVRTYQT